MTRRIRGPIMRYGGKTAIADQIVPLLPRGRIYLEPFFGAGGLFFAIPEGAYPQEVVNDLDHGIVTFFRVLRERPDDLRRALEATPFAREEFRLARERSDDPLEEARRMWVRARQSFAGVGRHWAVPRPLDPLPMRPHHGERQLPRLESFAARLRQVAIESRDGISLIAEFARPHVAIYVDPPYLPETRKSYGKSAYEHELTTARHVDLLDACRAASTAGARVAISGYPSDTYDGALAGWRRREIITRAGHRGVISKRTEVIWMSYPESESLGGGVQSQGSLFEARP